MASIENSSAQEAPGLATRKTVAAILDAVLRHRQPLDELLSGRNANAEFLKLDERDRALARNIVATSLRRLGSLRHILTQCLDRGLPPHAPQLEAILLTGAAQILFLNVPDHAAVDLAMRLVQENRFLAPYATLTNAVLRRIAREHTALLASLDPLCDTPDWLMQSWQRAYGEKTARAIALANGQEAALDLTVKSDPQGWAEKLGGNVLPNGSVRLIAPGPVTALPGYDEGAWWVQDAAASFPAHLFGDVRGKKIADLCAAPGGKTAQLAFAGAEVIAIDRSRPRLARLQENLSRLGLSAETIATDAASWQDGPFDAVLLDAPCSATGTIRRHPDIPWQKQPADIDKLSALQQRLLDNAARLVRPGGLIVYCTCSLEPEEGEEAIASFLARTPDMVRRPISAAEIFNQAEFLNRNGELRTLPCHWPHESPRKSGLDGFFAARLERR